MIVKLPKSKFYDEWFTPPQIVEALGTFDLDPACSSLCPNRLAKKRFGPRENGLKQPWHGRVWLNPPFSNAGPFARRMIQHGKGTMLLFATGYQTKWHWDVMKAAGCFLILEGKPKFGRPQKSLTNQIRPRVWLIPFGKRDADALMNSELPGLFLSVKNP